jgi:hypothetical protein
MTQFGIPNIIDIGNPVLFYIVFAAIFLSRLYFDGLAVFDGGRVYYRDFAAESGVNERSLDDDALGYFVGAVD